MFSTLASRLRALAALRSAREVFLFARLGALAATVPLLMRLSLARVAALLTRDPRPHFGELYHLPPAAA